MLGDVSGEVFIFVALEHKSNTWNNSRRDSKTETERGARTGEIRRGKEKREER